MARNNTLIDGDLFLGSVSSASTSYNLVWNPSTELVTYESYARPASATSVVYDVDITAVGWTFSSVTNGNPTSAGQISVNSSTATAVSTVKINKTANASSNQTTQLEGLAVSSSFTLTQAGGGLGEGTYRIVTTTDNTSYMTYAVTYVGGGSGTYTVSQIVTMDTITSDTYYEYTLNNGYNLLDIRNNGDGNDAIRFKVPNNAATGNRVIVEAAINASSQNVPLTFQMRSGSVSSTGQVNQKVYPIGLSGSQANVVLLDTNDVAVLEYTVWGTGSSVNYGLVPSAAMQVFNN